MKIVVSAIQPTGNLHIGNYLGSLKKWSKLQDDNRCLFPIVDLHAISGSKVHNKKLYNDILLTCSAYIASGVDPQKAIIFQQSDVCYHTELMWILANITSVGKLNRMTQFKDKGKNKTGASLGLFSYPVLMAADILLYNTDLVPVGEDQLQHLELTNDIAASFNANYNIDYFKKVDPIISDKTKRVMSLRDGSAKMSKSDLSDMTRINLTDSNDDIIQKIKKAKTDAFEDITVDLDSRPEAKNLLNIFAACTDSSIEEVTTKYKGKNFSDFKSDLSDAIINIIEPIRTKINELSNDKTYIESSLQTGSSKAVELADRNIAEIRKIIGFKS